MRIDIITIFPSYFDALKLSLIARAVKRGILEVFVHDLRDATHDRHRTVDDTPMGGGPGMVMRPEPWGELLDTLLTGDRTNESRQLPGSGSQQPSNGSDPLIIFPSPAGQVFTQNLAREFSAETQLIFGCGRYEGPDQRIFDEYSERGRVRLVSLGDYVLNGGEVATLAMIEAICRLIPGVIGNPESLLEESHENGLLEYPSYTKPAVWRGREVPSVLRSGNHAAITAWRRAQSLERTLRLRPELLESTDVEGDAEGNSA